MAFWPVRFHRAIIHNMAIKHGDKTRKNAHPLYSLHTRMKTRCYYKSGDKYHYYGGRGITVCDEWHDYIPFKKWALSNGYGIGLTIERIDNDAGYNPNNCTFIPMSEQAYNKRLTKRNTTGFHGITEIEYGKFRARVLYKGKRTNIGCFDTPEDAAIARDEFIILNNLPHALNFKRD